MCLLSYVPNVDGGFCLASSRDEDKNREKAILPREKRIHGKIVLFPKDTRGGGTWMAWTKQKTIVLLNGALERHQRKEHYRHSRGLVVLNFFKYGNWTQFIEQYDFSDLEPFRIFLFDNAKEEEVIEMIWDGDKLRMRKHNNDETHLWCSSTLYSPDKVDRLKLAFDKFNDGEGGCNEELYDFHAQNTYYNEDIPQVATLSISHSKIDKDIVRILFHDLKIDTKQNIRLYS